MKTRGVGALVLVCAVLLLGAHAPIMVVEGLITMFTVSFIARVRPEMLHMTHADTSRSC